MDVLNRTSNETTTISSLLEHVTYQDLLIGCILAISGNLLISISLNVQKYTHMKNEALGDQIHYTKDPLWWIGLVLMAVGEIGNFSAYGFAPASLVAPLGTTTVVANIFLAAIFLKEKIRAEHLFGSALTVIGAFLIVTFSSSKEKVFEGSEVTEALKTMTFTVYIIIEIIVLGVVLFLLYKVKMKKVVIYLLIADIIASITVICAKAVSGMLQLTFEGFSQMSYPGLYIMAIAMVVSAVIQVKYLNMAMREFNSTVVVPTHFVFFTISAILAGIIFYKEFWGMNGLEICMFLVGCILSFIGVYFITVGKTPGSIEETQGEPLNNTEHSQQVSPSLFPSWLFATINVGEVQPKGEVSHLTDTDREPILPTDVVYHASDDTLFSEGDQQQQNYGATTDST
ncbi:NIPA-like protein 2 isoform X1 [Mytilus trossulus]|uniref:NIPA-like protein 2 isoform X1 n=1 Tax=Mytilus trossulus TaxID=6551 RepID=UPI00300745DE